MSDATPAYRGYRLQTLYTLARVLEPNERTDLIFQPEGAEDLAVWDTGDRLLETVQVKAYSANLTLSSLSPDKVDSFFYRANGLLSTYPEMRIRIASFGDIGAELFQATQGDGWERQRVAQKISEYRFLSEADARRLLHQLQIISVAESELEERVFTALRNLCTGIDPVPAFEMLNFWLYLCAENKCKITQNDVIQRINDVGRFIAERNAHHGEWFRSIVPIENDEVNAQAREKLSDEFYRGVSARYEHILAGVDKPRTSKLNEISQKFKEKQVVIVHGASGQGKTTIAYRYLHDFFPAQWRFQVRFVENRQQALNIATALSGQAKAIGIPIAVYLDVSPNDIGWDELVKQLASHKNIQILVTVREEDFRRASISGVEIQFAEVELQFARSEAEEIYQFLVETETPTQFLDFDDAWNRFGGEGPLMEFVYLVTQGDSLQERLKQQIRRIEDEVNAEKRPSAELKLLRLVSVASAFEARLNVRELVRSLKLPAPKRTLEVLENEYYLLRTTENGALVGGLHPIRSAIVTNLLTDPICIPWSESASECLPFIFEQDIGSFLLYAFSRHRLELEPLLSALDTYQPRQWIALAGVTRALIWLGTKEYVEANRQLIADAYEFANHAWAFFLDFDMTDAVPGAIERLQSTLMPVLSEEQREQISAFRNRQTDRSQAFVRASSWLSHLTQKPIPPQRELDWTGMAEVLFWSGRLQVALPFSDWLSHVDLNGAVETLPLEILADVALGLFYGYEAIYQSWLAINHTRLISRFREETRTVALEEDEQNIRAHFVVELFQPDTSLPKAQTHQKDIQREFLNASMERLRLLRRFFPDRERYGNRGYGHLIWLNAELHDETEKDIPHLNFPLPWLVSLNATFKALGEKDVRPDTWEEYARIVVELRRTSLQVLQQLKQGLEIYFRKQQMFHILGESVESHLWKHCRRLLEFSPWLPSCAFDEWGFVTENIERIAESNENEPNKRQNLALEKYNAYLKAFNKYVCACSKFFEHAEWGLNFHPYIRNGENTKVQELVGRAKIDLIEQARLSVLYLGDARKALPKLQEDFSRLLSQFVESHELNDLERLERETFNSIWYSWYFFAFYPNRRFQNASQDCMQQFNKKAREIRNNIRKELRAISSDSVQVSILSEDVQWEEERSLWLKIDGKNAFEVYGTVEAVVTAIQRAINSVQNHELRRYAIEFTWSNIVIVPLVRGKSLDATAWRFSSILFSVDPNQDLKWWNFVTAIPSSAFSQLALSTWNHPRLTIIQKLMGLIFQLSLLASHIRDFERLPELDEQGRELLQQYIQQCTMPLCEAFQAVLDVEVEIGNYFNELSSLEQTNRPHLIAGRQALVELHEQILPRAGCSIDGRIEVAMSVTEIAEWANRLNEVQRQVPFMYLFWVSDVLEETQALHT